MVLFDIEFDQDMFVQYTKELHQHLFGALTLEDLFSEVHDHHQKHHLLTLHLMRNKETFDHYYNQRSELGLTSIFDIIVDTLTENVAGDKIKEHLVAFLMLSPDMKTDDVKDYDKKVFMKNLKSFMMYARKRKGVFSNEPKID